MCGRYTIIRLKQVLEIIQNITLKVDLSVEVARWNVAPGQDIPIILKRDTFMLEKARWGLVPSWAKDPAIGNRMINARAETLKEKPAFRQAFQSRRCAIPADGFYEWRKNADGSKTPMYIRLKSHTPFAFAGLWESWISPHGEELTTFTIITTVPNTLVAPIHDRMPVILSLDAVVHWIDGTPGDVNGLLLPMDAGAMEAYPVSNRVKHSQGEGPQFIKSVEEMETLF